MKTFFFSSHLLSMTLCTHLFVLSMLIVPDTQKATRIHCRIIIKCFSGSFTSVPVEVRYHGRHEVFGCAGSSGGYWVCHCTGWLPYSCVHSLLATHPHSFCSQLVMQLWLAQAVCPVLWTDQIQTLCSMLLHEYCGFRRRWMWAMNLMQPVAVYNNVTLLGWAQECAGCQQLSAEYTGTGCVSSDVHWQKKQYYIFCIYIAFYVAENVNTYMRSM